MRHFRLPLIAAGLLSLQGLASAGTLASVNLTLSELQVSTTALTADAVASVSFEAAITGGIGDTAYTPASGGVQAFYATVSDNGSVQSQTWSVAGAPFPTGTASFTSASGMAQINVSPSTVSTTVSVNDSQTGTLWANGGSDVLAGALMYPTDLVGSPSLANTWIVTVSAQTSVTFSGLLSYSANLDSNALDASLTDLALATGKSPTLLALVDAEFYAWSLEDGVLVSALETNSVNYLFGQNGGQFQLLDLTTLPLAVTVTNDSDVARTYAFTFASAVGFSAAMDDTVPAVVPEPSTWALMGLGLVGIGAVTRRRHASA